MGNFNASDTGSSSPGVPPHTHTFTTDGAGAHSHTYAYAFPLANGSAVTGAIYDPYNSKVSTDGVSNHTHTGTTNSTGTGSAHTHTPGSPKGYGLHVWVRTA